MSKMNRIPRIPIMLLVVIFLVMMSLMFIYVSRLLADKQLDHLVTKRDYAVSEINNELTEVESVLISVSKTIEIGISLEDLHQNLLSLEEEFDHITQMFYGLEDNRYIITAIDFSEEIIVTERPWYVKAKANGKITYTDTYIDIVTNKPVITVAIPIYDADDLLVGVLGADVEILTITNFINSFIEEDKGYSFLVDGLKNVIGHPSLVNGFDGLISAEDLDIPLESFDQTVGVTGYIRSNGVFGKVAYEYIKGSSIVFGIFITSTELNQSVRTMMVVSTAFMILLIFVIGVIVFIYKNQIEKPMNRLIEDINKIDISKNSNFRLDISQNAFHEARVALNNLIDTSIDYQVQLEESLENLSLENQKFELLLSSSSDIVFVIDHDKRYVNIYGDVENILGLDKNDMLGKTHEEVFGTKYAKERSNHYEQALNGNSVIYSWENEHHGQTYYFENIVNPIYNHEKEIVGAVGVARDITEQENRYQQLLYVSNHDFLTDLYNRKVYDERLKELNDQRAYPFAIVNLDFNGLKLINDAFGHEIGDLALKKTARILLSSVTDDCTVSRVSGDEFAIIVPNARKSDVDKIKDRIKSQLEKTKVKNLSLSAAIGYYIQKDDTTSIDEARKLAENYMYKQKILDRKSVKNKAISAILKTLTDKFSYEKMHSERVEQIAVQIGKVLNLDEDTLKALAAAAMFHDIGKISIPDEILNKQGKLSKEEYEIIKTHTTIGYDILNTADEYSELAIHASSHHERYDGQGYPNGLKGDQIPLFSRIIAVADAYEAMTSDRPYRKKLPKSKARQEIIDHSGTQFDPLIAKVFVEEVLDKHEH